MTAEAPGFRFPSDIYDFLTTADLKIETLTRRHRGEIQPYVRLTRKVELNLEGERIQLSQIHVFDHDLKALDSALFSGIKDVVPGSPIETAQQNFFAVSEAIKAKKPLV